MLVTKLRVRLICKVFMVGVLYMWLLSLLLFTVHVGQYTIFFYVHMYMKKDSDICFVLLFLTDAPIQAVHKLFL